MIDVQSWSFRPITFILVFLVVINQGQNVIAEHGVVGDSATDDEIWFIFNQSPGVRVNNQLLELDGMSSIPLRDVSWFVIDMSNDETSDPLVQGLYLQSVRPLEENLYEWQHSINISGFHCSCLIEFWIVFNENHVLQTSLPVYLGSDNHRPILQTAERMPENSNILVTGEQLSVDFLAITPNDNLTDSNVEVSYCQSLDGICQTVENHTSMAYDIIGESVLHTTLDLSKLEISDGFFTFKFTFISQTLLHSNPVMIDFLIDRNAPLAEFDSPLLVNENEQFLVELSIDDFYEQSETTVNWYLQKNSDQREPLHQSSLMAPKLASFQLNESGVYHITCVIKDQAQHVTTISQVITVSNIPPVAVILVDGLEQFDGQRLVYGIDETWNLNATLSYDTDPINFLWVVNGENAYRGLSVLESLVFTDSGTYSVELIVFDDDGATDSTTLTIDLLAHQEPISGDESYFQPLQFVGLLLLFTLLIYLLVRRTDEDETESSLPKWSDVHQD